jgi:hypothetical protein
MKENQADDKQQNLECRPDYTIEVSSHLPI